MARFLKAGFILSASADSLKRKDIIIVQHNCSLRRVARGDKATGFWKNKSKLYNFLLIMHKHTFVFKKSAQE
jgi:hypothetical protein